MTVLYLISLFFVEIFVTHRIDGEKLEKLRQARISTIEIDLRKKSSMLSIDELTSILLNDGAEKRWKYNSLYEQSYHQFIRVSEEKEVIHRGYAMHVDDCPIRKRIWKGKPYANFIDDSRHNHFLFSAVLIFSLSPLPSVRSRSSEMAHFFRMEFFFISRSACLLPASWKPVPSTSIASTGCLSI